LRWDGGWPRSSQDYDLYLVYYDGSQWRIPNCSFFPCISENLQDGSQPPFESIDTFAPFTGYFGVVITKFDADGNHFLDLLGGHNQPPLTHYSPSRSLIPAATSQDVFSIAAVDVNSLALESYSSRGPTYGPGNSPSGGFAQPRMAAYANVATYALPGFNGTSSATPHVAGAAAVVKSAANCLSARQIGEWLMKNSLDKGAAGYDSSYGSGVLNFPALNARPRCYANQHYIPSIHH
jgi:subtilisin family serine protease